MIAPGIGLLLGRITALARPSIRPSVCFVCASNSKRKLHEKKTKLAWTFPRNGVTNVPINNSKGQRLKVRVRVRVKVAKLQADDRIICRQWADLALWVDGVEMAVGLLQRVTWPMTSRWRHDSFVDHNFAQYGAEQASPAIGHSVSLDINKSASDWLGALQM